MAKTVNLSVKNVPASLAKRLRDRAARNHRSLQSELRAILEHAGRQMTVGDLATWVQRVGLATPSESAQMIREDRDDPSR